ncbi:probable serine/threonine-protein kinase SIS8 [Salvia miltiorrhiza]|uniref:probable serine/threonine-protein kinase SIS8 n=1 Tax=Salvia miltiorrhiza TaxID=226208 RepID=UPI0025AC246A|nr:probable serine/threonine-protein kinase SIS8 [Salvia miltiorrhiza]
MSKMKHLLRKLHIGDHQNLGRQPPPPVLDQPAQTASSQLSASSSPSPSPSPSPLPDLPQAASSSSENEGSGTNFNYLEEEFQMQLALAISVSDPGQTCVDSETAQINAVKQISLGRSPSQSLAEFLSLRYWSCNVVNYDEKVIDGFYDVCGIDSSLMVQTKMPSLVDLEAISVLNNVDFEVVLVNRGADLELRRLEEIVHFMSIECLALNTSQSTSSLVQKIADLIVERMGGPVSDVEEMFWRWRARSQELRVNFNTVILPLGSLDIGHSRQRALLFKVLADRVNIPCKLIKGSYHTGTDDGAVNLIKLDSGSEYIIDLMGAPGALIPAEAPSGRLQNLGLDITTVAAMGIGSFSAADQGARAESSSTFVDETAKTESSNPELSQVATAANRNGGKFAGKIQSDLLEHATGDIYLPSLVAGKKTNLVELRVEDVPRKHTAEKFRVPLDSVGYRSSFGTQHEQRVTFEDRKDEAVPNAGAATGIELIDSSGNGEAIDIAYTDQSNANKIQNMQIDSAINGVSEMLWEDLQIGERIGIGSYGEVYRAEWNGTEVAVKRFMKQDISGDALAQFRCEVEIMLRLRHPNIVLFMGAVLRPPNMSILMEYLPRGSLYKLLHRPNIQIDEKRRIRMAMDVAKGMNYLHTSHPIIVHRDLKTPNLLVDKNWVVKVCDFGMSRLQHNTFLSSKSTAGTAEWMAPEVLRNEPSNEKSDVYSFGVILWELATLRVPWTEMNSMQVVGAVGFQDRHLDIPPMVDPQVADIIRDCWIRNPQGRPSFAQIIARLKGVHRLSVQRTDSRENPSLM